MAGWLQGRPQSAIGSHKSNYGSDGKFQSGLKVMAATFLFYTFLLLFLRLFSAVVISNRSAVRLHPD